MTTFSPIEQSKQNQWQAIVIYALAFWLSATAIVDFVIMPSLFAAGMMAQPSFATAGYSIFWIFNRLELLCAALVITGCLVVKNTQNFRSNWSNPAIIISLLLLTITLIDTYALTPTMSGMGMQLNLFEPATVPAGMNLMHQSYWALELLKIMAAGALLNLGLRKAS
ncbi:MAG TPA: DUF4149 domain-containing protein [Halomicronema sp.]